MFLAWYINLTWLKLQNNKNKYKSNNVCNSAGNNQWVVPSTCASYTNIFMIFSQCWWVDLHVEQLCECCQHVSNTKRIKDFYFSFLIAFTINTAKYLLLHKSCYSISCLSLHFGQLVYIVIYNRDVLSSGIYACVLISTLLAKEKGII